MQVCFYNSPCHSYLTCGYFSKDHVELGFHLQGMVDQVKDLIDPMEPLDFGAGPAPMDLASGDSGVEDGDGDSEAESEAEAEAGP